jgi:hypothetical protein
MEEKVEKDRRQQGKEDTKVQKQLELEQKRIERERLKKEREKKKGKEGSRTGSKKITTRGGQRSCTTPESF